MDYIADSTAEEKLFKHSFRMTILCIDFDELKIIRNPTFACREYKAETFESYLPGM